MLPQTYVVLDVETTGLDPGRDRIIEIAAVRLEGGNIARQFQTLVNPGRPIPPAIERLTGICDAMVREAPPLPEVLPGLLELFRDAIPVGHNGAFDLAFLNQALGHGWHSPLLDTLALSRILFPCLASHRLDYMSKHLTLEATGHHRALDDALTTARLLENLWQATLALDKNLLAKLLKLAPAGLQPWFQAALVQETPASHFEVAATGLFAPAGVPSPQPGNLPAFNVDDLVAMLAPGGLLAEQITGYEYRPQQGDMLRAVASALAGNYYLTVEAGTGTGKSLAYLLPAIYWACSQRKRVAIATHTISLQEQLWQKDLPQLRELLPFSFKAALVKGRSNYICRRKLRDYLANPPAGEGERLFAMRVLRWLELTTSGDWSEMKLTPEEEGFKSALAADTETCTGSACPFNDECFVNTARREAEAANILILNHSLLLSDIRLNNQVLPDYPYLIIDEAHHLEEAATEHLGSSVSQASCEFFFRRLGRWEQAFSFLGRVRNLARRLPPGGNSELAGFMEDMEVTITATLAGWQGFLESLDRLSEAARWEEAGYTLRFTSRLKETPAWDNLLSVFGSLEENLSGLASRLERLSELLSATGAGEYAADASNFAAIVAQYSYDLGQILDADPATSVSWLEKNNHGQYILRSAPLDIGPLLAELLFSRKQAVILTSATLTVNNSFDYYHQQTGLQELPADRVVSCQVSSPFDYRSQALVCSIRGLPNPGQLKDADYARAITPVLTAICPAVGGRSLILCTSHRFLREVYELLSADLNGSGYRVLAQGIDGSRSRLLEEFIQTPRAVLLGANSYWEGIDLPGDLLRCVIIPRLPFPSPGIPTLAARMEHLAARGQNAFATLSLPQAIIRFRQGFGRLIRRASDRGVLVILDQRLLSQRYGRLFIQSLPPVTLEEVDPAGAPSRIKTWFQG
ncbi:MAG: ATP-dependent helicase DinG [Moorella sp. (in: firmicutes)]|nr:ATP-dependent helicase DinG [Moorella sp. (in: firmicutes)]